jgi:glycosyltransferase involved in cell wall biosynthesis
MLVSEHCDRSIDAERPPDWSLSLVMTPNDIDQPPATVTRNVIAAIWVGDHELGGDLRVLIGRLLEEGVGSVVLGASHALALPPPVVELEADIVDVVVAPSVIEFLNAVFERRNGHVLAVEAGAVLPPGLLRRADQLARDDPRVGSVSFLPPDRGFANDVAPHRRVDLSGTDSEASSASESPLAFSPPAVAVPFAVGPAKLLTHSLVASRGPLAQPPSGSHDVAIADYCLTSQGRGFVHLADLGTTVSVQREPAPVRAASDATTPSSHSPEDHEWLLTRHPALPAMLDAFTGPSSAFGLAWNVRRAQLEGLRVLIDGRQLVGLQMGTQTAVMHQVSALGRHRTVAEVCVALGEEPPSYARDALGGHKVRTQIVADGDLDACGTFDIGHQPFNPGDPRLRGTRFGRADRHVASVLDLIAFDTAEFFATPEEWEGYREHMREKVGHVDGVVAISEDVASTIRRNALAVDPTRIFVVPLGTDHLQGRGDHAVPPALHDLGYSGAPFMLTLGTNLACRNRDLAIRAWRLLRGRGKAVELVLAGTPLHFGTTTGSEDLTPHDRGAYDLGPVSDGDRDWLLAHASLALCTSSAEGFGLVPFEAARFSTPALTVRFGPFAEFGAGVPVWSAGWTAEDFASAAEALLMDADLAQRQVAARRRVSAELTWDAHADRLVGVYLELLARPPMSRAPATSVRKEGQSEVGDARADPFATSRSRRSVRRDAVGTRLSSIWRRGPPA